MHFLIFLLIFTEQKPPIQGGDPKVAPLQTNLSNGRSEYHLVRIHENVCKHKPLKREQAKRQQLKAWHYGIDSSIEFSTEMILIDPDWSVRERRERQGSSQNQSIAESSIVDRKNPIDLADLAELLRTKAVAIIIYNNNVFLFFSLSRSPSTGGRSHHVLV